MDVFKLSRTWFDFSFENPDIINPNHAAMYFFIIEHCNRLGWKEKFGLPMEMTKDAIGIKNYRTYAKTFSDLVEWGFIKVIQKSKNQYSATVIAIVENAKANTKALSKAIQKHSQKQCKGIVGIDIPINLKPINLSEPPIGDSPAKKEKYYFIDKIIGKFSNQYLIIRGVEYYIPNKGKERSAASKLLEIYKGKYPDMNSEKMLEGLEAFFIRCIEQTNDNWLHENMSLPIIVNKINVLNTILKSNGKATKPNRQSPATSPEQLAAAIANGFARGQGN
jgi:hypothetical protein